MKMELNSFQFDLSLDELHWLAGAFGITRLPLPEHNQEEMTHEQLLQKQRNGHASLLTRGLIRPSPGFGWQVDRLPAAIFQWMAAAGSMLRMEQIEKGGGKTYLHVFTSGEQALSVEIESNFAKFFLYKTHASLKESLQIWLKIPAKSGISKNTFSIPQPQTFIPLVWKDPKLAAQILKNNGLSVNSKLLIEWAASLKCLKTLSNIQINSEMSGCSEQFMVGNDEKTLWGSGNSDQEKTNHFAMFYTITETVMDAKISEMVQSLGD